MSGSLPRLQEQAFGDLLNFNPHVHSVVPEGVFLETGEFVGLPDAQMHRAEEFWRERVFALLLDSHKIDEATAGSMRTWAYSGYSVDISVRIEANDRAAMSRLVWLHLALSDLPGAHDYAHR